MDAVFKMLNDAYGIDFSHYKPNTVGRRIQRRVSMVGARTLEQYVSKLRDDAEELNSLYRDLLIGVTRFFRDRDAFLKLEQDVIPELIKSADDQEIRIWVAGCATGEEAYSLAMLFHEQLERAGKPINLKIFATDVHRASLEIASAGIYAEDALADVSPERLERYFEKQRDGYHVIPDLRQLTVFATHNVTNDAPFTKLDLITCRNLLIYFQHTAQRKALSLFHFGLKTGGYLFLGPSESPGELIEEYDDVDVHWKIYRKRRHVRLPGDLQLPLSSGIRTLPASLSSTPSPNATSPDPSLVAAYDQLLSRFMPPGLLINEKRELLHAFGGAERFLSLKSGRPSGDVLDLLDRELRTAVTGAVQRVLRDRTAVSYSGVRVTQDDREQKMRVTVEPVPNPRSKYAQLLILIESLEEPLPVNDASPASEMDGDMQQMSADRIEALESELRYTKENLQATIEELETSNEEMQATNEELVASNEELQSTNEELQSVNEELYTVNAEYQKKINELSELTSDMDNLLAAPRSARSFSTANSRSANSRRRSPGVSPASRRTSAARSTALPTTYLHVRVDRGSPPRRGNGNALRKRGQGSQREMALSADFALSHQDEESGRRRAHADGHHQRQTGRA
jgi:two-component system, chemotaxis family, CheB/CheR fusion protein